MAKYKKLILLVVGSVTSGLGAVYYTHAYIERHTSENTSHISDSVQLTKVVVANANLNKNDILDYQNLSIRELPLKYVHSTAVLPGNVEYVIGRHLLHQIKKGEVLLSSFVDSVEDKEISKLIGDGERAVTIQVDNLSTAAGLLRPGHKIDIILTMNSEKKVTRPVLKNVTVLATGDRLVNEMTDNNSRFNTITISVSPTNASRIVLARNMGSLSITLRSNKNTAVSENESHPVSVQNLFGLSDRKAVDKRRVEVIVDGNIHNER